MLFVAKRIATQGLRFTAFKGLQRLRAIYGYLAGVPGIQGVEA